jgi:hypothetical protein
MFRGQMTLKFTRLGGSPTEPFCTELTDWPPDVTSLSVHVSRLPGLTLVAKKSWILTDDVELYFEFRGYSSSTTDVHSFCRGSTCTGPRTMGFPGSHSK